MKQTEFEVLTDQKCKEDITYMRIWKQVKALQLSSSEIIEDMANVLYGFNGKVYYPNTQDENRVVYTIPDIDKIIGDRRWVSYYYEEQNGKPKRKARLLEKVRLLDLYLQLKAACV